MVTKGHRRLDRTIRILQNSVEISPKESQAKESEKKYKEKAQKLIEPDEDSPVQSLSNALTQRKNSKEPHV
jgi:hypothetical protein